MAFKKVTTGLTSLNLVIDEILDFVQNDLAAPWTLEYNIRPTAGATTISSAGDTGRNTWISKAPAEPTTGQAFKGLASPDPPEKMYIGFRTVSAGGTGNGNTGGTPAIQFGASGNRDGGQSPGDAFRNDVNQLLWEWRGWGFSTSQPTVVPFSSCEGFNAPYTSLYLFGPNQTSPEDPNIPNYVYFVLEFSPGRFTHGMFGEFKKLVPFKGGWGCAGSSRGRDQDGVTTSTNGTMWNDLHSGNSGGGDFYIAADIGQRQKVGKSNYGRWFQSKQPLSNGTSDGEFYPVSKWGHVRNRDWMINTSQARLSGFYPLVTPLLGLGDSNTGTVTNSPEPSDCEYMPACYPEDFFLGDITPYEPGVEVEVGGVTVVPFPVVSKLSTSPRSDYGGYFYRKRA